MSDPSERPIFISYSREDTHRVGELVDALTDEGLSIFWDENIGGGQRWWNVIPDVIRKAAAVVVIWTKNSVQSEYVKEEAALSKRYNVMLPVMFEGGVVIPFGFAGVEYFDLCGWHGERDLEFTRLITALHAMVELRKRGPYYVDQPWQENTFKDLTEATVELQDLTGTVRELSEVLANDRPVIKDISAALDEVGKTYRVVWDAIEEFLSPAVESGHIDGKPYLRMEDGSLESRINQGLGHCTRILTLYRRHRGLRDAVKRRVDEKKLKEIDSAFDDLSDADKDMFQRLSRIGWLLTAESEAIATMLTAGRSEAARNRIREGRKHLSPLRKQLTAAISDLQDAQRVLGYAETSGD